MFHDNYTKDEDKYFDTFSDNNKDKNNRIKLGVTVTSIISQSGTSIPYSLPIIGDTHLVVNGNLVRLLKCTFCNFRNISEHVIDHHILHTEDAEHNSDLESLIKRNTGILSLEKLKGLAYQWNLEHCLPPLDEKECEGQWNDALKFLQTNQEKEDSKDNENEFDLVMTASEVIRM
jgi:hypothetical protein